ncbi:LAMI_0A06700g1_1 [Lachancea mirantina]|uniref:LAMI_0A06700g1_1 n=1 Tax=Lachancea mirantina TaxID=1230905 RepID=A0A1G4IQH5_9SACH|nr:LAMI_0A06700g1_1 [Lachancea mirantina]
MSRRRDFVGFYNIHDRRASQHTGLSSGPNCRCRGKISRAMCKKVTCIAPVRLPYVPFVPVFAFMCLYSGICTPISSSITATHSYNLEKSAMHCRCAHAVVQRLPAFAVPLVSRSFPDEPGNIFVRFFNGSLQWRWNLMFLTTTYQITNQQKRVIYYLLLAI